jgi:hypothetical protein
MSKTQDRLEGASKAVGAACRALVRQVQDIIKEKHSGDTDAEDYAKLSSHEFKVREMEQQVCVFLVFFVLSFSSPAFPHLLYPSIALTPCVYNMC